MLINILKNRISNLGEIRIHQGIAFEWTDEEIFYADIEYPEEIAPTGLPIVAYFLALDESEQPNAGLLHIIEEDFKLRQGVEIQHFVAIFIKTELGSAQYYGFHKKNDIVRECQVSIIDEKPEAIYFPLVNSDSNIWFRKKVVIVGCGTFGSGLALELCKAGVNNFVLIDNGVFKKNDMHRTFAPIVYEGRKKNQVLKEAILIKNPIAKVKALDIDITIETDTFKFESKNADIVIGLTNQRTNFLLINQVALELEIPAVFAITNSLASFGYIYRFDPSNLKSPCLNCMGIGQFFLRGETIYYERSGPTSLISVNQSNDKEEALSIDLLPYVYMLARTCVEILSEGLIHTIPGVSLEEYSLLVYPTGLYPDGQDPINNKSLVNYKKMQWYPVSVIRDPSCSFCGSR